MQQKPIFLNLFLIKFPLSAIVSILHRVSGVILFLAIPVFLYCLKESLVAQRNFDEIKYLASLQSVKFVIFGIISMLIYHIFAGIRHMLMDYGIGETKVSGKISAQIVIISFVIVLVIIGKWLLW
jgi:succinate dehydrogenase / fumarate reductase cytochrome b subunit